MIYKNDILKFVINEDLCYLDKKPGVFGSLPLTSVSDLDPDLDPDPDPYVFGPPGSGSKSQRYTAPDPDPSIKKNLGFYHFVTRSFNYNNSISP